MFSVNVKDRNDKLPTMYWLPKLHKKRIKLDFYANSISCTTTELSKSLTSCLTAVKTLAIRNCANVYNMLGKNCFGLLKILVR